MLRRMSDVPLSPLPKMARLSDEFNDIFYDNSSLSSTMPKFYLKEELADVYFVFRENNKRIQVPAHKMLLAIGSDVFKAMFYGELKEEQVVTIVDASMSAFEEFLQFFYRNKVKLTMENVSDVLNLAKKYMAVGCLEVCEEFLEDKLTSENVCHVYGLAELFDLDDLKRKCKSTIDTNTKEVLQSSSFLKCERSVIGHILKSEDLSCSEVELFHASIAWLKEKTDQQQVTKDTVRTHLGDLFYETRFGSMTFKEFASIIKTYGQLLSVDEYQEIIQMIDSKDYQSKIFTKGSRKPMAKRRPISFSFDLEEDISYESMTIMNDSSELL